MIPQSLRAKFAAQCRMTCMSGSEKGTCECASPKECEMQTSPYFAEAREKAKATMSRYLLNALKEEQ